MSEATTGTALVTGATSGLGFEAAAQLVESGYQTVLVAGRTIEKADRARQALELRTGGDRYQTIVIDNDDLGSVDRAVDDLVAQGVEIDLLLLNAGIAPPKQVAHTTAGLEATVAASLIGHHRLTMGLLEHGRLAPSARIVIAGSEAARGDVPTFNPVDIRQLAEGFGGDLAAAIEAQMRMGPSMRYKPADTYATVKMFVAWWAAELATRLPDGMTVNAVSPGSTPDTNAINNAPFYMRRIMVPFFKLMPGMSHSVSEGAKRYLEVAGYDSSITGEFFASAPKKMTGPLVPIRMDHIDDEAGRSALWDVTTRITGATTPSLR